MARHYVGNSNSGVKVDSPEALAQALNDPEKAGEIFGSRQSADKFRAEYARQMFADGSLDVQIREQTQVGLAEFLKANGGSGAAPPVALAPAGRSAVKAAMYNKAAPGAAVDHVFGNAAELCSSVSWRSSHDQAAQGRLAKAMNIQNSFGSEVPADGGFLIPEVLRSDILMMALESAIVRPRAQVIPMDSLRVPIPMIDDTTHTSTVLGGVQFYWTEEAASLAESQASFGRVVLDAKKLTGYFAVPNELLADAPAFGAFFDKVVPLGLSFAEDVSFMTGTGVGEPLGFVNCPASVQVAAEVGQPTATIVWENITKMFARMLPQSLRTAVWIASIDTFPQLATMALSVGTGGGPVWIGGYPGAGGGMSGADIPPVTILGRPVLFTEKLPTLGTTGDICFTDLGFYLLGDRQTMQISSSEHFLFQNDKTAFRIIERADARPWTQAPLTPKNNGPTLSAFVQLATR